MLGAMSNVNHASLAAPSWASLLPPVVDALSPGAAAARDAAAWFDEGAVDAAQLLRAPAAGATESPSVLAARFLDALIGAEPA
jgi:hypothetical protein